MILRDAIENIRFYTSTQNDLTGRASNQIFTNSQILQQLQLVLNIYAQETLGIEGVYSFGLDQNSYTHPFPRDILRGTTFRAVNYYLNGTLWTLLGTDWNLANSNFPFSPINGVPRYFVPWEDQLYFFPKTGVPITNTTLTANINERDTTIPVENTGGFFGNFGRMTIGTEKIRYRNKTATSFEGCERGVEGTTAAKHNQNDIVYENNFQLYYYRLHKNITSRDNNLTEEQLCTPLEVNDAHVHIVLKQTAYELLAKIDTNRAQIYKMDYMEWLTKAKWDVLKGRDATSKSGEVRLPFLFESESVYYNL